LIFILLALSVTVGFSNVKMPTTEAELDPAGANVGKEWIELYSRGEASPNLGEWTATSRTVTSTIAPNQYLSFRTACGWLDNPHESMGFYDRCGMETGRLPLVSSSSNGRSWQSFLSGADSGPPRDWAFKNSKMWHTAGSITTQTTAEATVVANNVTVYFIDVGQGDGIFIDTWGRDVLIDGGSRSGGDAVLSELRKLGIRMIHLMIATHPDSDHIGGLIKVLQAQDISVGSVLYTGEERNTQTYRDFINLALQRNYTLARRGQTYSLADGVALEILNPSRPLEFSQSNDNSIVARLTVGRVAFLFTGDCEVRCETSIMNSGLTISSEVLKVGHHGSRTSTSNSFLDRVGPRVAIISAGRDNPYGHPHQETIDKLVARGITPYSTAQSGTIIVTSDGSVYTLLGNPVPIPEFPAAVVLTALLAMLILSGIIFGRRLGLRNKRLSNEPRANL